MNKHGAIFSQPALIWELLDNNEIIRYCPRESTHVDLPTPGDKHGAIFNRPLFGKILDDNEVSR